MRLTGKPAGPQGLGVLAATGVAGIVLAVHGWSGRHAGLPAGTLAGAGSPQVPRASSPSPARTSGPAAAPGTSGASPVARPGPLLSTQSYAAYSFEVWPGRPGATGRTAMTGLSISVHHQGSGISVIAGVSGQPAPAARFYPRGARVYVVEASLGDDSGNSDYALGDDGLVVTDSQGRILQ